jgi:hypothetical protein
MERWNDQISKKPSSPTPKFAYDLRCMQCESRTISKMMLEKEWLCNLSKMSKMMLEKEWLCNLFKMFS